MQHWKRAGGLEGGEGVGVVVVDSVGRRSEEHTGPRPQGSHVRCTKVLQCCVGGGGGHRGNEGQGSVGRGIAFRSDGGA